MLAGPAHQHGTHVGCRVDRAPDVGKVTVHGLGRGVLPALVRDHQLEDAVGGRLETEGRKRAPQGFDGGRHGQAPAASGTACTLTMVSTW